jgi:hypothetical protein
MTSNDNIQKNPNSIYNETGYSIPTYIIFWHNGEIKHTNDINKWLISLYTNECAELFTNAHYKNTSGVPDASDWPTPESLKNLTYNELYNVVSEGYTELGNMSFSVYKYMSI